jgi:acyl-CoA hydrolase
MTVYHDDFLKAAHQIVDRVGKEIIIGVPLGIGKPIGLLNALYSLALADKSIKLTIMTALTLSRPTYSSELEERFVSPLLDRILGNYEDPLYEKARLQQSLPENINVIEFFLTTGKYLHNNYVQQHYISSTYTLAVRDSLDLGVNVVAQQVSPSTTNPDVCSLSSNSDLFHAIVLGLQKLEAQGKKTAIIAEINPNLPFMHGEAVINKTICTDIVDTKSYPALFAIPHDQLSYQDHLIGLYTSFLIPDDSCLQIGIGKLSNSLANALILRHKNNGVYQDLFLTLAIDAKFPAIVAENGALSVFEKGIYASTEMLSDGYLELYKEKILKKRVYDHAGLQKLLNAGKISEKITSQTLDILLNNQLISANLTIDDVDFLKKFGILQADIMLQMGNLVLSTGETIPADLHVRENMNWIIQHCLGEKLLAGKIIHAGFFLGTNNFYQQLRDLSEDELSQIDMTTIERTNTLLWSYDLLQAQRQRGRFVNTTMMVTLGGAAISDGLKDMQEVSGIGGQFDFVNMAQSLDDARSILNCHSTRKSKHGVTSNIVWDYANLNIPRFLRDIVVTEYGIADCRSKTDSDVIKAMLNIADSRFQPGLLKQAKLAGKISDNYEIPASYCQNYPEKIRPSVQALQAQGFCESYPFGTELTADEQVIARALLFLKNLSSGRMIWVLSKAFCFTASDKVYLSYLVRMRLDKPQNLKEYLYKKLLKFAIHTTDPRQSVSVH